MLEGGFAVLPDKVGPDVTVGEKATPSVSAMTESETKQSQMGIREDALLVTTIYRYSFSLRFILDRPTIDINYVHSSLNLVNNR